MKRLNKITVIILSIIGMHLQAADTDAGHTTQVAQVDVVGIQDVSRDELVRLWADALQSVATVERGREELLRRNQGLERELQQKDRFLALMHQELVRMRMQGIQRDALHSRNLALQRQQFADLQERKNAQIAAFVQEFRNLLGQLQVEFDRMRTIPQAPAHTVGVAVVTQAQPTVVPMPDLSRASRWDNVQPVMRRGGRQQ